MGDNSPIAYLRDDNAVAIRASAFGRCIRELWAVLDGVEPQSAPDFLTRAAEEGNLHEDQIRQNLSKQLGRDVYGDQETLELWIIPNKLVIVGHCDGYLAPLKPSGKPDLLEIKTMSRKVFDDWMAHGFDSKPGYAWQLSCYMLASGWPNDIKGAIYASKRRDDGLVDEQYFDTPPHSLKEVRLKALALYKAYRTGEMPACDLPPNKRYPCSVFFMHDEDNPEGFEPEEAPDLDLLAAEYVELGEAESFAKKRRKELKAQMAEFRDGRESFGTDHYLIKVAKVPRTSLDKAAIRSEHGEDFLKRYEDVSHYDRWTVKERT